MTTTTELSLSINLQDHYFPVADIGTNPIAPEEWSQWGQAWLQQLQPDLPQSDCTLSLRLTGDREIRALNAQYRQRDEPTDVLAFAALESSLPVLPEGEPLELGDLVISVETAQRQAQSQGWSLREELAWLASHGFLHLLGWDHPDPASLQAMLAAQAKLLIAVGFVRGDRPELRSGC
ncbi:MAG: rRNA maturation RNase YbeY [Spirulinaceae cyanobacterium RM2_2_10]|nr:rRNA maturation RNase YbeY [Spirulinaceae cyanobacterium SM2_1_0]NJO20642.1 rRNA maturation RNase YbeY [Spirulinaceae cyanobacterium RM2_2_10]